MVSYAADLRMLIGARALSGWTSIEVNTGIEQCPNSFRLAMTERFLSQAAKTVIVPGDPCSIYLGRDLILTGYVDRFMPSVSAERHRITVVGRGKCQDLVDCSAEWPGGQIAAGNALKIAQVLAAPYGIKVSATCDVGRPLPQFNITYGETPFEIISRMGKYRGFVAFEGRDGNLVLAQAGSDRHASGVVEGVNVQEATATYAVDQRFSNYRVLLNAFDILEDKSERANLAARATDTGVKRHRQLDTVAGIGEYALPDNVAQKRANWLAAHNAGSGAVLMVEVDSWRDADGKLWAPNAILPIALPSLKAQAGLPWTIGSARFLLDEHGTRAVLTIKPRGAFLPEPELINAELLALSEAPS